MDRFKGKRITLGLKLHLGSVRTSNLAGTFANGLLPTATVGGNWCKVRHHLFLGGNQLVELQDFICRSLDVGVVVLQLFQGGQLAEVVHEPSSLLLEMDFRLQRLHQLWPELDSHLGELCDQIITNDDLAVLNGDAIADVRPHVIRHAVLGKLPKPAFMEAHQTVQLGACIPEGFTLVGQPFKLAPRLLELFNLLSAEVCHGS